MTDQLCSTCRFWDTTFEKITWGIRALIPGRPEAGVDEWDDARAEALLPYPIGVCECPGIPFYEFPSETGATTVDGSEYRGDLVTGPKFGCVLWQAHD